MIKRVFSAIIRRIKSRYYTLKYVDGKGEIYFASNSVKLKVRKGKNAKLNIDGKLMVISHLMGTNQTNIVLGERAKLSVRGDFQLGNGVTIALAEDARLTIGGKLKESNSGITANSTLMVNKKIAIGRDFLCAWDVFITDSDWHSIEGQHHQGDVIIGDHVWIAHKSSILKGTIIGDGCIVASHSKLGNKEYPEDSLIGGTPGKVLRTDVSWNGNLK